MEATCKEIITRTKSEIQEAVHVNWKELAQSIISKFFFSQALKHVWTWYSTVV